MKNRIINFWKRVLKILTRNDMLTLPGQLAFFLLLAIVPTLTVIIYVASFFNVSIDFLTSFLLKAFGSDVANLILPMVSEISFSPSVLIPLFVALYAASGGASSIIVTSNQLYKIENTSFIKRKTKGIIMTLILIILILFLLVIPVFGNKFIAAIEYANMHENVTSVLTSIVNLSQNPITWFLIFFLIKIIYTMAPDASIPSKCTTKGSLFTTFGLVISTFVYSTYVNNVAHYDVVYGSLSHFIVLMIWFYIIAYVITIGIAINADDVNKELKKEENHQNENNP